MSLNATLVKKIKQKIVDEACRRSTNAAYNGDFDDGGASRLLEIADAWEDGLNQRIPKKFQSFYEEAMKEQDPEYYTFLMLKKKFES